MRWVLPYIDQPGAFWERVAEAVAPDRAMVYFPLSAVAAVATGAAPIASGRPPQPRAHIRALLASDSVERSVLLNPIVHDGPAECVFAEVEPALRRLTQESAIAEAVLASVGLARLVRTAFPALSLAASTLLEVSTPAQAVYLEGLFDTLVPSDRAMRNLGVLGALRDAFPGRIRLMVNEGCLPGCVYRTQHFYEMARGEALSASLCAGLMRREPWLALTGAWVLPQHLGLYDGLYDEIKLDGRVTLRDPERYLRVLRAYVTREPLQLAEIGGGPATEPSVPEITREFYEYTLTCPRTCATCDVCRTYYGSARR